MVSMVNNTPTHGTSSAVLCKQSPATTTFSRTNAGHQTVKTRSPIQRKAKRHRKQTITSRLSDSGIEEDLSALPSPSSSSSSSSSSFSTGEGTAAAGQLGLLTWHQHYGDIGYRVHKDNETHFHLPKCLERQPQVTAEARCKLVRWLISVHKHFHLSFECCCLAVNIMDRFLASTAVAADCFQLLGVEVFSPRIRQLLGLCCDAFSKEQLCNLECLILLRLNFRLAAPTLAFFVEYHINCGEAALLAPQVDGGASPPAVQEAKSSSAAQQCNDLARRICELTLADYTFNQYLPSLTATCALRLSTELLRAGGDLGESDEPMRLELVGSEEEGQPSGTFESGNLSESWMDSDPGPSDEQGFGPLSEGRHCHARALECREHLKRLVALNRESLPATTMALTLQPSRSLETRQERARRKGRVLMPRSSSPDPVFVDTMPCIVEQAFATIAWDDLEDCASVLRRESDSLGSQVNESDGDDQYFGEYALDFMAESPGTLESSLSPVRLVPFQGCIIPPLTPQRDFPPQDSPMAPSPEPGDCHAQDGAPWRGLAKHQGWLLDNSTQVKHRLHETLHSKQEEIESLQERNVHLRELASRAKHLASVLEKLMTVRDPCLQGPAPPPCENTSRSPCKRQRLSEESETESASSGSVEDILRDISTRCNAVLHRASGAQQESSGSQGSDRVRMYGAFSGLRTSVADGSSGSSGSSGASASAGGTGLDDGDSSFRTSIRDHCTIKTQVFPHGHAFTSRTQTGGYRFRWVPNQS
ncbi:hypothetical protein NHX12_029308 [Muraenolepis orangiensis]|uniref:Multicilin n=1 Tax=Muraenolepis orangiensis TaxID=630683 RepID=A0A9Q0EDU3_9TELE|nr:hypothetical protein NHX12_029308 [Muraenolepis orangiensis]